VFDNQVIGVSFRNYNGQRYVFVADYGARNYQPVMKFEASHSL